MGIDADRRAQFGPSGPICPTPVAAALERALELDEVGLQVAAYAGERLIVDAWIGAAAPDADRPVDADSLFPIFSVTKAYPTFAVHLQAERGLLAYDDRVADHWPEFATNGKGDVRIADVLTHRSGVPNLPPGTGIDEMADWEHMCRGIAALEPVAPPRTKSTYQARSMGWMLGEVVRRTDPDGRDFGTFLRQEVLDPLGVEDTWLGLPEREEPRLVELIGEYSGPTAAGQAPLRAVSYGPLTAPEIYGSRKLRAACLPASGAITTARAEARFWSVLANGGELGGHRFLAPERVRSLTRPRTDPDQLDEVLGLVPLIGVGGFWLGGSYPRAEAGVGDGAVLCQPGAGGSIGWADLDRGIGVAICHNRVFVNNPPRPAAGHPMVAIGDAVRQVADGV